MIKVNSISYAYGTKQAITDVSFKAAPGEILAILGPNGGGKTTLLKCLNHTIIPQKGEIFLNDKDISMLVQREIATLTAMVPQQFETIFPFTVYETLMMGCYAIQGDLSHEQIQSHLREIMILTGIENLRERYINELSGGERQLVFVARAIVQDAPILLLDEATSNLDISHTATILRSIKKMVIEKKISVIAVIHDINLAVRFSDKIMFLNGKEHTEPLLPSEILTKDNISKFYGIEKNDIEIDDSLLVNIKLDV